MTRLLFDINDTGILGSLLPGGGVENLGAGYALQEENGLFLGEAARARSRSRPRALRCRFWQKFGDPPGHSSNNGQSRSSDLVHFQLSQIWKRFQDKAQTVAMAVPGCFTQQQLGLLRGMAETMGMPLTSMMDSALAAALPVLAGSSHGNLKPGQRILFADLHLHRVTWTGLQCGPVEGSNIPWVMNETSGQVGKTGLVPLTELWARFLAEAFVRTTRFDPFFKGSTEQSLYDGIPTWLREIRKRGKATVSLQGPGHPLNLETTAREWVAAVEPAYRHIRDVLQPTLQRWQPALVLLSHRIASLPGLAQAITSGFPGTILSLPRDGVLRGIQAVAEKGQTTGTSFQLVVQQPMPKNNPEGNCEAMLIPTEQAATQPTHVLVEAVAYRLNQKKITFTNGAPVNGAGICLPRGASPFHFEFHQDATGPVLKAITGCCRVNGREVRNPTRLAVGDRISVKGAKIEMQLILEAT